MKKSWSLRCSAYPWVQLILAGPLYVGCFGASIGFIRRSDLYPCQMRDQDHRFYCSHRYSHQYRTADVLDDGDIGRFMG